MTSNNLLNYYKNSKVHKKARVKYLRNNKISSSKCN